ncbi:MAG: hypothetical protein ACHQIM_22300 [Sphingobacteriales bacterium]
MNIKMLLLLIALTLAHATNIYCAQVCGEISIDGKDKAKNPIMHPSCTKQAPCNLTNIDRAAPLLYVCVTLSTDKKRDWHYLPLESFQNKDRSFKKKGDVIELAALSSIKEFNTKFKLKLDESFNSVELQKKYEEFNSEATSSTCFSCMPCIECIVQ